MEYNRAVLPVKLKEPLSQDPRDIHPIQPTTRQSKVLQFIQVKVPLQTSQRMLELT